MSAAPDIAHQLQTVADDAGIHAWVHARRITDTDDMVSLHADAAVPMASLYKVPVTACWSNQAATGRLDPLAPITLQPADRTAGPTGVSVLQDTVTVSQRDCVRMALALSDNASATAVLNLVGHDAVQAWLTQAGCSNTVARRGTADAMTEVIRESGGRTLEEALRALADPSVDRSTSEYDAALASSSTARDCTTMLSYLWTQEYAEPVRAAMRLQAWRHRIGAGFPHDDVSLAGKTGTLGRLRHEIAVVEFPHEIPVAVAVLTRSLRPEMHQPRVDTAIGVLARLAVNRMRRHGAPTAAGQHIPHSRQRQRQPTVS